MPATTEPGAALRVLAFDTSTEQLAAGLSAASGHHTVNVAGGAQASVNLLPQLAALLARAGLAHADLDAIAFGRGPGAFTGLRTACAVAQGLGLGLGLPLLAIDSLLIVAEDALAQAGTQGGRFDIGVAMDARMNEAYAARYRWLGGWHGDLEAGAWEVLEEPSLLTLPALAQAWAGLELDAVAGSALAAFGPRLALPAAARFEREHDRAAALLRLALRAALCGAGMDAASALPLYLRDKVALTTRERDAVKAAAAAAALPVPP
jgi:tRNA threonylcarbamoyladenosine biosynthesis protein TsaB